MFANRELSFCSLPRTFVAALLASGVVALACNSLTGLDQLKPVNCAGDCGVADSAPDVMDAGAVAYDGAPCAPPPAPTRAWARWVMPNPDGGQNRATYGVDGGVVSDLLTGLSWQLGALAATSSGSATCSCAAMDGGWLLPTRIELASLIDPTRAMPAIDPVFSGTPTDHPFWTASVLPGNDAGTWAVDFASGMVSGKLPTPGYVRCVKLPVDGGP